MIDSFRTAHTRRLLHRAHRRGLLDDRAHQRACALLPLPTEWWRGIAWLLLVLGTTMVLAGILFFFAYNWQEMTPFTKFAVLQAGLVITVVLACVKGLRTRTGRVFVIAASLLLGVFLAVFGQIYQTGADSYTLFVTWALLLLPWVLMLRFGALWLFWLIVANTGLILYLSQDGAVHLTQNPFFFPLIVACFNGFVFLIGERFRSAEIPRLPLWAMLLICASLPLLDWFVHLDTPRWGQLVSLGFWSLSAGLGYGFFRYRRPDFRALAMVLISVALVVATLIVNILQLGTSSLAFFLVGLGILGSFSLAILALYRLRAQMGGAS